MAMEESARADVPPSRPPSIATRSDSTTRASIGRRIFMSRCSPFAISERGVQDLGRRLERHALRRRDRGRQRPQERGSAVVDLPTQRHGVVLVQGVVAVLHEHPAKVTELHGDLDTSVRAEAIDVLAPLLPRRHAAGTSVSLEDLPLLEVDVDRMIPVAAVVHQVPDLAGAEPRRRRDPSEVRVEHFSAVGPDAQGPRNDVTGSLVVWVAPSPNRNVRVRATGMADRSGFGIRVAGTWLGSVPPVGPRTIRNSRNLPTHGSLELPDSAADSERVCDGIVPSSCASRFTIDTVCPML